MPNQGKFVRQTATVLMACGLIASLLPDLAAAQDLSTPTARQIIPLSGQWQFTTGSMDSRPSNFDKEVTVPGFHPGGEALWYRRMVTIEGPLPEVIRLEVKKASWGVKVWVNGSEAGESWSTRTASFIDISKFLKGNGFENEIILRVCGSSDLVPPEIPWFSSIIFLEEPDFKVHKKNGLYDSVNLILSDAPYVVRAQAAPDVQDDSVKLAVTLRHISSGAQPAQLKIRIVDDQTGDTVATAESSHEAGVGESTSEIDIHIPDAKLWSPETPHLYRFEIEVNSEGRHTDTYASRFGMRSFSICQDTGRGLLNGRPILLTGVGMFSMWDGFVFYENSMYDDSAIRHAFRFVKKLRGNAVRFSFDLMPEIWYRIADEEGILVQDEAHWNINETATLKAVTAEFTDWIHEHANHPSVVIWDAANETVKSGPLLREAVKAVRHLDLSNRPWEPSTWFHHTQEAPVLSQKGDVTEWHPYSVFDYLGDGRWKFLFSDGLYPEIFEKGPNPRPVHPGWIVNEYCGLFLNRDGSFYLMQSKRFADAYFAEANGSHYLFGRSRFVAWEAEYYRRLPGCLGVLWNSYLWGPGIQQPLASQTLSEKELALGRYIADAVAPVGVMVNHWKTKIPTGRLKVPVSVANDGPNPWSGMLRLSLLRAGDNLSKIGALFEPPETQAEIDERIVRHWQKTLHDVPVSQQGEVVFDAVIPQPGNYHLMAEITGLDGQPVRSWRDFVSIAQASTCVARSTFFVGGPDASDTNPGTAAAPFATIQAAANVAQPGDVVKIRDGIYRETVVPSNSGTEENPIVFEADAGAEPVISGADLVTTNWQPANHANLNPASPIYETTVQLPPVEYISHDPAVTGNEVLMAQQIFVRSKMMQEARWPKIPYADFDHPMKGNNHARVLRFEDEGGPWAGSVSNDNLVIRDNGLPNVPGGLAGAHCQVLCWYVPACAAVLSSSGKEFVVDDDMPGANKHMRNRLATLRDLWAYKDRHQEQFRYWIRGALGLLTGEGEFYYDESQNKLYLWAPGGGLPENVEYKARNWGFDLTGKPYIHLKHLNFFACDIPTNGESLWPTNAKTWDAIQPVPAQYTQTEKPTYPTVQAKADAEGFTAGAHPSDRFNPAAVPDPANGILIDYCRFKYLNHQTFMVAMPGGSPPALEFSETGFQQGNSNTNYGNMHRCGVRLTGDNCIVRNSVFDTASGSHLMVTGKTCRIENNYFKNANYIGNWSSSIGAGVVATGLKVYGNTFWRSGRTHLWNLQDHVEVSFNDWSEWSYLSVDGGGTYSHSRHRNNSNHGSRWNEGMYRQYFGYNLLGRKERPADADLSDSFGLEGSVWHHNWCHDSRTFDAAHEASGGIYFDGSTDGTVVHHNVIWKARAIDLRAPNTYSNSRHDYESTPLGINWLYNNTFGTPSNGKDGVAKGVDRNSVTVMHYGDHSHAMHNNIYRATAAPGWVVPYTLNSTELQLNNNNANHVWHDHKGPTGAYNSSPANGKPWLIGFGPGQYASGLGFVLKAGSPAVNKGARVDQLRYGNDDIHVDLRSKLLTDALGRPLDYVDDPVNDAGPDAGAYEFGGPQVPGAPRYYNHPGHPAHGAWIPGTTLSREFIEGQPWEKQWAAKRKF